MAKPNYTVVLTGNEFKIVPITDVPFEVKGTSMHKAKLIKQELDNA